jgi:hypothetical protein
MLIRRTSGKVDGHDRGGATTDPLATARAILTSVKQSEGRRGAWETTLIKRGGLRRIADSCGEG